MMDEGRVCAWAVFGERLLEWRGIGGCCGGGNKTRGGLINRDGATSSRGLGIKSHFAVSTSLQSKTPQVDQTFR